MTLPRRVLPGQVYMVQRRCVQRQLLLTPSPVVEQVLTYCLAHAAQRYSIDVFCFVAMGNHWHGGVVDRHGNLPKFMALFNSLVARALKVHHGRGEAFWAAGSYSAVALGTDAETVLDKLVYMITNPVDAGLVERAEHWPGLVTLPTDLGQRELVASKPAFFFRRADEPQDGDDTAAGRARRRAPPRDVLPDVVRLRLTRPPGFDDLGDDGLRRLVAERVEIRTAELRERRRREGKHAVLGAATVLLQRPVDGPANAAPSFGLNPRLACKDKWRRVQMAQDLLAFWRAHLEAATRYRAGERGVLFPEGTYWYRVHFSARCRRAAAG